MWCDQRHREGGWSWLGLIVLMAAAATSTSEVLAPRAIDVPAERPHMAPGRAVGDVVHHTSDVRAFGMLFSYLAAAAERRPGARARRA